MSAYEKLARLIVERGAAPIAGRIEQSGRETYSIAKNAGDKRFLRFIADRLVHVHGEDPNVDYVLTLRKFADAFEPGTTAPALPVDAGEGLVPAIKPLVWSEPAPPNGETCFYDHVTAECSLGKFSIEWKSWKVRDDRTVFLNGEWVGNGGATLEGAKALAEQHVRTVVAGLLAAAAPQPPGVSPAPDALAALIPDDPIERRHIYGYSHDPHDQSRDDEARAAIAQVETGKAGASEGRFSDEFSSGYRKVCADSAPSPEPSRQGVEAMRDVAAERERQKTIEGWTPEHDDTHSHGELARAAACYGAGYEIWFGTPGHGMTRGSRVLLGSSRVWPFDHEWWKPTTPRRNLIKAGALILAEIERLDRMKQRSQDVGGGCTAGVGCDEYGCCYADAHGEPEKCPRTATLAQHQGAGQTSGAE